jgi:hypothetical protein
LARFGGKLRGIDGILALAAGIREVGTALGFTRNFFDLDTPKYRGVRLRFQATAGADIEIMVDGVVIARERMTGSSSPRYEFNVPAGLHGVRVKKYDPGFFLLDRVIID